MYNQYSQPSTHYDPNAYTPTPPPFQQQYAQARSPPPLQHPVPQHPIPQFSTSSPSPQLASQPRPAPQNPYIPQQPYHQPSSSHQPDFYQQFGLNDPTAQMGMQFAGSAMKAGTTYMEQNLNRWINIPALKHYFNVNNMYVINKLRLVLFPWRHKTWARLGRRADNGQVEGYRPPREDLNSPDLYIPMMAFVTYILIVGTMVGKEQKFHPEVLGMTASTALAVIVFEFLVIRLGLYLLSIPSEAAVLDLIAYSGYKFVGIIVTECVRLLGGNGWIVWGTFFYAALAVGFFLLRSLRYVVLQDASQSHMVTPHHMLPSNFGVSNDGVEAQGLAFDLSPSGADNSLFSAQEQKHLQSFLNDLGNEANFGMDIDADMAKDMPPAPMSRQNDHSRAFDGVDALLLSSHLQNNPTFQAFHNYQQSLSAAQNVSIHPLQASPYLESSRRTNIYSTRSRDQVEPLLLSSSDKMPTAATLNVGSPTQKPIKRPPPTTKYTKRKSASDGEVGTSLSSKLPGKQSTRSTSISHGMSAYMDPSSPVPRSAASPTPYSTPRKRSTSPSSTSTKASSKKQTQKRPYRRRTLHLAQQESDPSDLNAKPPDLLTEAEKKANHIASEQKRRQNIRDGYDQLVEIVPALSKCHRSEALILNKSIDYIRHLIEEKQELKMRVREMQMNAGEIPDEDVVSEYDMDSE